MINNNLKPMNVMMKKWILFMFVFAGLAFAACSNDDVIDESGGGTEVDSKEDAWVSLRISMPSATRSATRNTGTGTDNGNQENALPAESEIKSLQAIFFTGFQESSTVTNIIDLIGGGYTSADGTSVLNAFKVSGSAQSILIVANAPTGFSPAVGQSYATVNAKTSSNADAVIASTNGFMMTNAKGGLEPTIETAAGTGVYTDAPLTLHSSEDDAKGSPLTITLDRVVTKVRLYLTGGTASSDRATVDDVQWILNVTNKIYYPVSKRTKTQYELDNPTYKVTADKYGYGSYRIDPNYDNSSNAYTEGGSDTDNANYIANYTYYTETNVPTWIDPTSATTPGDDQEDPGNLKNTSLFCLENTQIATDNTHAYTTQALVKATYLPKEYEQADETSTSDQEPASAAGKGENDWMMINGGYYTYTTLVGWIERELNAYYSGTSDSKALTDVFNEYLTSLTGVGAVTLTNKSDVPSSTPVADAVQNAITAFNDKKDAVKDHDDKVQALTTANGSTLNYYSNNGLCYYKIPIKHDDRDNLNNLLGEFGCVRNSVYDIYISKFNSPGYPTIPNPEHKPDEANAYLAVKIEINPWTWYVQTEDL